MNNISFIRDLPSVKVLKNAVVTIGNFDGLHLGHRKIINEVLKKATEKNLSSMVITFEPLPQSFLRPHQAMFRLTTLSQKIALLSRWGINQVIALRFNAKLASLSAVDFVRYYLAEILNIHTLIVGEGFHFGYQKSGDIALLQTLGQQFHFQVICVNNALVNDPKESFKEKISSTLCRDALLKNDLQKVKSLLGRNYSISQRVQRGHALGKQLGFPTANLKIGLNKNLLKGVFVTKVIFEGSRYNGVANIGSRPTVDGTNNLIEVHLLDFSGNLYGKKIEVEFLHKLRDEMHFANTSLLKQQISQDIQKARMYVEACGF